MFRRILGEALQPVNDRLDGLEKGQTDIVKRLDTLENGQTTLDKRMGTLERGQRRMQKDASEIKLQLRGVWDDILRLDNRLIEQEKITGNK